MMAVVVGLACQGPLVGTMSAQEAADELTHAQRVAGSQATYTVEVEGAEPVNRWVRVANVGASRISGGRLVANGKDWSSLDAILSAVVTPSMTAAEQVRAVWQFLRDARYHWYPPSYQTSENTDPVKLLSVYGYGFCTDVSLAAAALLEELGIPTRFWRLGAGEHDVIEAFYDGGWHVVDVDRLLLLDSDNVTLASVAKLKANPDLVQRGGTYSADLVSIYERTNLDSTFVSNSLYEKGHEVRLDLRPGDVFEYRWGPGRVHDEVGWSGSPPVRASAYHATSLGRQAAPLAWADEATGMAVVGAEDGRLFTARDGKAQLRYGIRLPYVITGSRLSLKATLADPGDEVSVAVSRMADGFRLLGTDLQRGEYRLEGLFVSDHNLATYEEDGNWPPLHVRTPGAPGRLTYRVKPLPNQAPIVHARFFRYGTADQVRVLSSLDGVEWTERWQGIEGEGFLDATVELPTAPDAEYVFVRLEFVAGTFESPFTGWTAGLQQLRMTGVASPAGVPVWSASWTGRSEVQQATLNLDSVLVPPGGSAIYAFEVQVYVASGTGTSGLNDLTVETDMQAAPLALPGLVRGGNVLVWSSDAADGVVEVTHAWVPSSVMELVEPPESPLYPADRATIGREAELALVWTPSRATSGVLQYQVQVCPDEDCRSAISTNFDLRTGFVSPGPDNVIGTPDDQAGPNGRSEVRLPFGQWLAYGRTYFWRVRAQGTEGTWSHWSRTWSFVVARGASGTGMRFDPVNVDTGQATASLNGRVASTTPLAKVQWVTDRGTTGLGAWGDDGTWSVDGVPLFPGPNLVSVIATDVNGAQVGTSQLVQGAAWHSVLAEGATGAFFAPEVTVANPTGTETFVRVTYLLPDGDTRERTLAVGPFSRETVKVWEEPGLQATDVSTVVTALDGRPLVVNRAMWWEPGRRYGGHGASALLQASRRWYFAEGQQAPFDTFLLVANATEQEAEVRVTFLRDTEPPVERTYTMPARARLTVYAASVPELIGRSFSMEVESSVPVHAERAMYFGRDPLWRGGHASAGVAAPRRTWTFAEAATGEFFDTYVLIANPGDAPATVRVSYLLDLGRPPVVRDYVVAPRSRFTVNVEHEAPELASAAMSVVVVADQPVVAERSMYWPGGPGTWVDGHNGFGATSAATRWGLAEGRCGGTGDYQAWLLLANPDATRAAEIDLTFLIEGGTPRQAQVTVPPAGRLTVPACSGGGLDGQRFGTLIESRNGVPVTAEQSLYWTADDVPWEGGLNIAATPLP